jgi:L-glutamine:2-deoxy-scyllo-inosose/3-amino-2,3-dideoxy-scyllo-inosose aminotransferase
MPQLAIHGGKPVSKAGAFKATWPVSDEADAQRVAEITRSNRWSFDGPVEWEFAQAFTKYQTAKFGACCANGTVGMQLALEALGIGAYDEVIVPGLTWQATAAACVDVNAIPILVDVEPDTWNLDIRAVEAAITRRTRAVMVVHLYGSMTDMGALQKLCKDRGLFLIEDCAHQHGSFWKGKGVGSLGDASSWSFQESKVLSSGEGGFNMCRDKAVFERLYSLRNCGRPYPAKPAVYGQKKASDWSTALQSGNYRVTEWQAALLLGGLGRLDQQVKLRDENAQYLNAQLAQIPGIAPMRRRREVTQQSYFNWAFSINAKDLKITNLQFVNALNAELSVDGAFDQPYEPLNRCTLYKPRTKERHKLNAEYWKAIDPKRFKLPVCEDVHLKSGACVHHVLLMNTKSEMDQVVAAVRKVVENIAEARQVKDPKSRKYAAAPVVRG